ncbi:MAG: hypothetical protein JXA78_09530 [Anaerolineales bacterium]|nr:hypothetical protein [Anaerolineales bacterium]
MESKNNLSDREIEILCLVAEGASNKEIAQKLYISTNTVKVHLRNIFAKIQVTSRTEAAVYAINEGLVSSKAPPSPEKGVDEESANGAIIEKEKGRNTTAKRFWVFFVFVLVASGLAIYSLWHNSRPEPADISTTQEEMRWQTKAPMPLARSGLAAVTYDRYVYIIGGKSEGGVTGQVDRYDPVSDTWTKMASKPTAVQEINAVVIGGKIYVPGGRLESDEVTSALEIYDPLQDTWANGAPLPKAVSAYSLAAFEGKMFLFGGWDGSRYLATVYGYDPENDTWNAEFSMPTPRGYSGAAVLGREIFVIGGLDGKGALQTNEMYRPDLSASQTDAWSAVKPIPEPVYAMGVANLGDIMYVVGGEGDLEREYPALAYFERSDEWRIIDKPSTPLGSHLGATVFEVYLYVFGGNIDGVPTPNNMAYQAIYTISFPIIVK